MVRVRVEIRVYVKPFCSAKKPLTDVSTRLNFFEVARAPLSSRNVSPRHEVRSI